MRSRTARAERLEVIEARLDLRPQETEDGHLVAGAQVQLDVGGVGVDAMGELIENGQRPRVMGGAEHVPGEGELGQEIGLDRP